MTCTNRQVELLMKIKNHKKKISLATIAAKTSMSGKTARKYLNSGKLPSELRKPRSHRTRNDPFAGHQDAIKAMLDTAPDLQAKTMLYYLMEQYPDQYKVMCQHFSGQLVTQIFVFFRTPHIPLVINNH